MLSFKPSLILLIHLLLTIAEKKGKDKWAIENLTESGPQWNEGE